MRAQLKQLVSYVRDHVSGDPSLAASFSQVGAALSPIQAPALSERVAAVSTPPSALRTAPHHAKPLAASLRERIERELEELRDILEGPQLSNTTMHHIQVRSCVDVFD